MTLPALVVCLIVVMVILTWLLALSILLHDVYCRCLDGTPFGTFTDAERDKIADDILQHRHREQLLVERHKQEIEALTAIYQGMIKAIRNGRTCDGTDEEVPSTSTPEVLAGRETDEQEEERAGVDSGHDLRADDDGERDHAGAAG